MGKEKKEHSPEIIVKVNKQSLTPEQFNYIVHFIYQMSTTGLEAFILTDEAPLIIKGRLRRLSLLARRQFQIEYEDDMIRCIGDINDGL